MAAATETARDDATYEGGPVIAHYGVPGDQTLALCGRQIIGVPAPPDHPVCGECVRAREALNRALERVR